MSESLAWLRAQLDEDERAAREATPGSWRWVTPGGKTKLALVNGDWRPPHLGGWDTVLSIAGEHLSKPDADHIESWDPARVLRLTAALRRVLFEYEAATQHQAQDANDPVSRLEKSLAKVTVPALERVVRSLAAALWADRPGFPEELKS